LEANTTGAYNTAVGQGALDQNTTANDNVAVGVDAMGDNTTGGNSVAVGYRALKSNTTASGNVALGRKALEENTTGSGNVAVGQIALSECTTGYQNVCIGDAAGDNLTTGARNVILGAAMNASAVGRNYEYAIGYNTAGNGEGTFYVHSSGGAYNGTNSSTWAQTSDIRIKKNVVDNNTGLDKLKQIQVRNFEYKTKEEIIEGSPELTDVIKSVVVDQEGTQLGVIAQEIEKVLPEVVDIQTTGIKTVDTGNLTWYMLNAIKELSAENTALKARLDAAGL